MFTGYPTYARYRTLRLTTPHQRGEDCYALQTALIGAGQPLTRFGADGDLGQETADAIVAIQRVLTINGVKLTVDGLAGGRTQEALARKLLLHPQEAYGLPLGLLRGQIGHESGFWLGNYSPLRADGNYDAGATQRNTKYTPAKDGFTVPVSIEALASRVRKHYDLFAGLRVDRRWSLAQGSWNSDAFACWIAREEGAQAVTRAMTLEPTAEERATFEEYVSDVSVYRV